MEGPPVPPSPYGIFRHPVVVVMDVLVEDEGWSGFVGTMIGVGQARGLCFGFWNL
jgi:hypothetical protein